MDNIFKEQASWRLHAFKYLSLPYEAKDEPLNINITPVDSIQITRRTLTDIVFLIKRTLSIQPIEAFSVNVEFEVTIEFADDSKTTELSDQEIIESFKNNCSGLLLLVLSRASLLIAEVTGSNGQIPIVTQPQFISA